MLVSVSDARRGRRATGGVSFGTDQRIELVEVRQFSPLMQASLFRLIRTTQSLNATVITCSFKMSGLMLS